MNYYMHPSGDNANWPSTSELLPIASPAGIVWGSLADQLGANDSLIFGGEITSSLIPDESGTSESAPLVIDGAWSGDRGRLNISAGTVAFYINGQSHIHAQHFDIDEAGTTACCLLNGTTAGNKLLDIDMTHTKARGLYVLGNAHADWSIDLVTINNNVLVPGNTQAVYIWGNNATAGNGGVISDLVINGGAAFDATNSNHVGLHVDDWDGLSVYGYICDNMHSAIRVTNSDNNVFNVASISNCGLGLKSDSSGGGFGVVVGASSAGNDFIGGSYDGNYQHWVDATSSGGSNRIIGSLMKNVRVNSISCTSTSPGTSAAYNNTIDQNPVDTEGHGIVVQNGSASTKFISKNNLVMCGKTGLNIQCVAIGGTSGTNYDDVELDYNCYHVTNGAKVGKLGLTEYDTLADWITAITADANISGNEANSIEADPLLDDSYAPQEGSPLIAAGIHWWGTAANPVDSGGEPFPQNNTPIGGIMPIYGNGLPRNLRYKND